MFTALDYAKKEACEYSNKAGMPKFSPKATNTNNSYTTITTKLP
jgi:hypothetical protein